MHVAVCGFSGFPGGTSESKVGLQTILGTGDVYGALYIFLHLHLYWFCNVLFIKSKTKKKPKKAFGNKSEEFPETFLPLKISVVQFDPKSRDTVYVSSCFPT